MIPTPFAQQATIAYAIPCDADVAISIYDVLGRCIRMLVESEQPAGRHAVRWDGSNEAGGMCSPGIYFVELRAGHQVLRTRTVLLW